MRRFSVLIALCLGVAAGCSQHPASSSLPALAQSGMTSLRPNTGFNPLYSFQSIPDGSGPFGRLLYSNGTFYGNTLRGGKNGLGAVYKVNASGKESVLYSFAGPPAGWPVPDCGADDQERSVLRHECERLRRRLWDGLEGQRVRRQATSCIVSKMSRTAKPRKGTLIALNGTFYGTTQFGGTYGIGTVFKISASGAEKVVYSFNVNASPLDGVYPVGDLIVVNGTLYGTTLNGGSSNHGTIFKISPSGMEHVLHEFKGKPDGSTPYAGLINVNGTLYGTTQYGGASDHGTVFKVSTTGAEHVVYSFKGSPDGSIPYGRLLSLNGTLYGTTQYGGANNIGAIFKVSTSGSEHVLHSFS